MSVGERRQFKSKMQEFKIKLTVHQISSDPKFKASTWPIYKGTLLNPWLTTIMHSLRLSGFSTLKLIIFK